MPLGGGHLVGEQFAPDAFRLSAMERNALSAAPASRAAESAQRPYLAIAIDAPLPANSSRAAQAEGRLKLLALTHRHAAYAHQAFRRCLAANGRTGDWTSWSPKTSSGSRSRRPPRALWPGIPRQRGAAADQRAVPSLRRRSAPGFVTRDMESQSLHPADCRPASGLGATSPRRNRRANSVTSQTTMSGGETVSHPISRAMPSVLFGPEGQGRFQRSRDCAELQRQEMPATRSMCGSGWPAGRRSSAPPEMSRIVRQSAMR